MAQTASLKFFYSTQNQIDDSKAVQYNTFNMILYKYYRNIDHIIYLLKEKKLHFGELGSFNDPYEDYLVFKDKKSGAVFISDDFKSSFRVLCLTKSEKNYLLWSHYAERHTGFCIGFDIPYSNDDDIQYIEKDGIDVAIVNVKYDPKQIVIDLDDENSFNDDLKIESLSYKSKCWSYEEEVRLAILSKYKEISINKNQIIRIISGIKCPIESRDIISKLLNEEEYIIQLEQAHAKFTNGIGIEIAIS